MGFRWDSNKAVQASEKIKDYQPIPAGEYRVVIADIEDKETKNGTGAYLALTLEVAEGPWAGRKIWENINYRNQSAKAEEIGWQTLASISAAIHGEPRELAISDMLGAVVKVKTRVELWDGKERAKVSRYLPDGPDTSHRRAASFRPVPDGVVPGAALGFEDVPF